VKEALLANFTQRREGAKLAKGINLKIIYKGDLW